MCCLFVRALPRRAALTFIVALVKKFSGTAFVASHPPPLPSPRLPRSGASFAYRVCLFCFRAYEQYDKYTPLFARASLCVIVVDAELPI